MPTSHAASTLNHPPPNLRRSHLLQVLECACITGVDKISPHKVMKSLTRPSRFRWSPRVGLEVGVPIDGDTLFTAREKRRRLRRRVLSAEEDGAKADKTYPWWLAQCIHYGLPFCFTRTDAKCRIGMALLAGKLKRPEVLRELARELKSMHKQNQGSTRKVEVEGSCTGEIHDGGSFDLGIYMGEKRKKTDRKGMKCAQSNQVPEPEESPTANVEGPPDNPLYKQRKKKKAKASRGSVEMGVTSQQQVRGSEDDQEISSNHHHENTLARITPPDSERSKLSRSSTAVFIPSSETEHEPKPEKSTDTIMPGAQNMYSQGRSNCNVVVEIPKNSAPRLTPSTPKLGRDDPIWDLPESSTGSANGSDTVTIEAGTPESYLDFLYKDEEYDRFSEYQASEVSPLAAQPKSRVTRSSAEKIASQFSRATSDPYSSSPCLGGISEAEKEISKREKKQSRLKHNLESRQCKTNGPRSEVPTDEVIVLPGMAQPKVPRTIDCPARKSRQNTKRASVAKNARLIDFPPTKFASALLQDQISPQSELRYRTEVADTLGPKNSSLRKTGQKKSPCAILTPVQTIDSIDGLTLSSAASEYARQSPHPTEREKRSVLDIKPELLAVRRKLTPAYEDDRDDGPARKSLSEAPTADCPSSAVKAAESSIRARNTASTISSDAIGAAERADRSHCSTVTPTVTTSSREKNASKASKPNAGKARRATGNISSPASRSSTTAAVSSIRNFRNTHFRSTSQLLSSVINKTSSIGVALMAASQKPSISPMRTSSSLVTEYMPEKVCGLQDDMPSEQLGRINSAEVEEDVQREDERVTVLTQATTTPKRKIQRPRRTAECGQSLKYSQPSAHQSFSRNLQSVRHSGLPSDARTDTIGQAINPAQSKPPTGSQARLTASAKKYIEEVLLPARDAQRKQVQTLRVRRQSSEKVVDRAGDSGIASCPGADLSKRKRAKLKTPKSQRNGTTANKKRRTFETEANESVEKTPSKTILKSTRPDKDYHTPQKVKTKRSQHKVSDVEDAAGIPTVLSPAEDDSTSGKHARDQEKGGRKANCRTSSSKKQVTEFMNYRATEDQSVGDEVSHDSVTSSKRSNDRKRDSRHPILHYIKPCRNMNPSFKAQRRTPAGGLMNQIGQPFGQEWDPNFNL